MKRRMTREEYEALWEKCSKRGLINSDGTGHHYDLAVGVGLGVTAALEELVEVEEPTRLTAIHNPNVFKAWFLDLDARVRKLEGR